MAVKWVYDEPSFRDFISIVMFHAPDKFIVENFLAESDQLNLARAFEWLRHGLQYVRVLKNDPARRATATDLLERSYQAYQRGEKYAGWGLLQAFEVCLGYATGKK